MFMPWMMESNAQFVARVKHQLRVAEASRAVAAQELFELGGLVSPGTYIELVFREPQDPTVAVSLDEFRGVSIPGERAQPTLEGAVDLGTRRYPVRVHGKPFGTFLVKEGNIIEVQHAPEYAAMLEAGFEKMPQADRLLYVDGRHYLWSPVSVAAFPTGFQLVYEQGFGVTP